MAHSSIFTQYLILKVNYGLSTEHVARAFDLL